MKRFVVLLNSEDAQSSSAVLEFFKGRGLGLWHWLVNSWLVVDPKDEWSSELLRDKFNEFYPGVHKVVIEIKGDDIWAGYGPQSGKRNMFKWLAHTWKGKPG